jgi:ABC-2 type transport system ATP-binding protein
MLAEAEAEDHEHTKGMKARNGQKEFSDLSFRLPAFRVFVILGPSQCGFMRKRRRSILDGTMAIIEIAGLAKSYRIYQKAEGLGASFKGLFRRKYRMVEAVRGIDLAVEQGEFVAFLGPNGAGKTTTLKLLSGVITPTSGTARVMGHVPWLRENAYRRRFALVMGQKNQLWWDLPAQESFRLHQKIYRIDPARFNETRDELVELLNVGKLLGQPVRELSLGERMKMELIAALLHSPEVLFLDEPTIGLDVVAQHNIQMFLRRYQQARKVTILLTSHYMKDVEALCKRVVIIAQGRIMYDGSLSGIIDRFSGHKVVTLQFPASERLPDDLARYGDVLEANAPRVSLRVDRPRVTEVLAHILDSHTIEDVSVEDPPLEEVIAGMFAMVEQHA